MSAAHSKVAAHFSVGRFALNDHVYPTFLPVSRDITLKWTWTLFIPLFTWNKPTESIGLWISLLGMVGGHHKMACSLGVHGRLHVLVTINIIER